MGAFSVKKIEVSEPITMYSDLESAIEFGESFATSRIEDDEGKGYLLGGLEVSNLNESNLSEETIARLSNALEAGNISYAVFPDDQRKGRLPLILDKNSRLFLETSLKELLDNPLIKWYLYKLPGDIDPDNNETSGSSFVLDDEERPIILNFDEIATYLDEFGFVEKQASSDIFDNSDEETEDDNNNTKSNNFNNNDGSDEEYYQNVFGTDETDDEDDLNEDEEADDFEESEVDNDSDYDNEAQDFSSMFSEPNEDIDANSDDIDTGEKDEILDIEDESLDVQDVPNDSTTKKVDNQIDETEFENLIENNTKEEPIENIEQEEIIENATDYVVLPEEVKEIIDRIALPRFTEFPKDGVYQVTANTMQKEVNDANNKIAVIENNIKRETIKLYRSNMANSFESIAKELNTQTGNEIVKNYYQTTIDAQKDIDIEYDNDLKEKERKLLDEFYGQRFENYKAEVLAKLQVWFEDEHFDEFVNEPLQKYKQERKEFYSDRKVDKLTQFNDWVKTLETTARGKDQQSAMIAIDDYVSSQIEAAMPHIHALQARMDEVNHSLTQTEYQERATENLRETVGKDLETDEQAKIYKSERDEVIQQKIKLDTEFAEFKANMEEEAKLAKKQHEKTLEDMKEQHKKEIEQHKSTADELEQQRRQEEEKAVKATKESNKKGNKKAVKFASIAALASALIFGGGTALSLNGQNKDHEQKIESQQKQINKTQDALKSQEKQIKSKDDEIKSKDDEIKSKDDEVKKAKDEAEKAKKSKKDKK